jgi:hypothetical protein
MDHDRADIRPCGEAGLGAMVAVVVLRPSD